MFLTEQPFQEAIIALLRGINVGGKNAVRTADLRRWVAGVGGADVRTYAQSGNILLKLDGEPSPPNPLSPSKHGRRVARSAGVRASHPPHSSPRSTDEPARRAITAMDHR